MYELIARYILPSPPRWLMIKTNKEIGKIENLKETKKNFSWWFYFGHTVVAISGTPCRECNSSKLFLHFSTTYDIVCTLHAALRRMCENNVKEGYSESAF